MSFCWETFKVIRDIKTLLQRFTNQGKYYFLLVLKFDDEFLILYFNNIFLKIDKNEERIINLIQFIFTFVLY